MTYPPPGEQPQYGPPPGEQQPQYGSPPPEQPPVQQPGYPPQTNAMPQQGYPPQGGMPGQPAAAPNFRSTRDPLPAFMLFGMAGVSLLLLIFEIVFANSSLYGEYFQWISLIFRLGLVGVCGGAGFLVLQQNMSLGTPAAYLASGAAGFTGLFTFSGQLDYLIEGVEVGFPGVALLLLGAANVGLAVVVVLKLLKPSPAGPQQPGQPQGYPQQAPGYPQQPGQAPGYPQGYPQQQPPPPPAPGQYG